MNIPQPDRGGNGETMGVVNQWLLLRPVDLRLHANATCPNLQRLHLGKARLNYGSVAPNPQSRSILDIAAKFL
jgi:hypothetical protein